MLVFHLCSHGGHVDLLRREALHGIAQAWEGDSRLRATRCPRRDHTALSDVRGFLLVQGSEHIILALLMLRVLLLNVALTAWFRSIDFGVRASAFTSSAGNIGEQGAFPALPYRSFSDRRRTLQVVSSLTLFPCTRLDPAKGEAACMFCFAAKKAGSASAASIGQIAE